jgi:hypothetical protein
MRKKGMAKRVNSLLLKDKKLWLNQAEALLDTIKARCGAKHLEIGGKGVFG